MFFFAGTNAACSEKTKDSKSSDWILQHLPARYPARKTLVPCTSIPFLIQHKTVLVWTLWLAATCELVSSMVHLSAGKSRGFESFDPCQTCTDLHGKLFLSISSCTEYYTRNARKSRIARSVQYA